MDGTKEQEIYFLIIIGMTIVLIFAIGFVIFYLFSQRKMFLQKMESKELLVQQTILAQEEERSRIAKDMHDEIGSKLNVISLHTQQLKLQTNGGSQLIETVDFLTANIKNAIDTTRRIAHDLLPPTLEEFGFVEALDELCDNYSRIEGLEVQLELDRNDFEIKDKLIELNLFRIFQELISNSLRHGKADDIQIKYVVEGNYKFFSYKDNGIGFDMDSKKNAKGLGMKSIESRLQMIKGEWEYSSKIGKGLNARIILN